MHSRITFDTPISVSPGDEWIDYQLNIDGTLELTIKQSDGTIRKEHREWTEEIFKED